MNAGILDRNGISDSDDFRLLLGNWGERVGGAAGP
jgi:hypothetical protein